MKKKLSRVLGLFFVIVLGGCFSLNLSHKNTSVSYAESPEKTYTYTVSNHSEDQNLLYVSAGLDDGSSYILTTDGSNDKIPSLADVLTLIKSDLPTETTEAHLVFDNYTYISTDQPTDFSAFKVDGTFYLRTTGTIIVPIETTSETLMFVNLPAIERNNIQFAATHDYYTVATQSNGNYTCPIITFNVDFQPNGGTIKSGYNPQIKHYSSGSSLDFPNSYTISKDNHTFKGWAGKLEITAQDETEFGIAAGTYYFDYNILKTFVNNQNNGDISLIPTLFATSSENISNFTGFTTYRYYETPATADEKTISESIMLFTNKLHKAPTFEAVWELNSHTISFVANPVYLNPETKPYGSTVTLPSLTGTITGYTFDGWFEDADFQTMVTNTTITVTENKTFYAKWSINEYTLTIKYQNGESDSVSNVVYLTDLTFSTPTAPEGHKFVEWIDATTNSKVTYQKMPAKDLVVIATYSKIQYTINFITNSEIGLEPIHVEYGDTIPAFTTPTREGYTFDGWHIEENCPDPSIDDHIKYETMPAKNLMFYAAWRINYYDIEFYLDRNDLVPDTRVNLSFNSPIKNSTVNHLPTNPTKTGFVFVEWLTEAGTPFNANGALMPAETLKLYASWTAKQVISIDTTKQSFEYNGFNHSFKNFSELSGFNVFYKVDGKWVLTAPTDAGSYDVRITRSEDNTYSAFDIEIKNALVIEPEVLNYGWLILLLFAIGIIEFGFAIVLRIMKKMKLNQPIIFVPHALLLANTIFSTSQLALIIVGGLFALAGLVFMIYQMVQLHRTIPLAYYEIQKQEESEEDDESRHKIAHDKSSEIKTFSSDDIKEMLSDSSYFDKLDEERKQKRLNEQESSNDENENN